MKIISQIWIWMILFSIMLAACQTAPVPTEPIKNVVTLTAGVTPSPTPTGKSGFNPFENLTPEQQSCLIKAWGNEDFTAITTFQRPPEKSEEGAIGECGLPGPDGKQQSGPSKTDPSTANPNPLKISGQYLMAFHACDSAKTACNDWNNHMVYLAQSDDGAKWEIVPGWVPYPGSVPDVIRRGQTVYIYTPGKLMRYHLDTGQSEGPIQVKADGGAEGFVDPSVTLDDQGRLVLFFLHGQPGSDPAQCQPNETSCKKRFGSATEVEGSDGASFKVDPGDRATVDLNSSGPVKTASDPDIFFDGKQYNLFIAYGPSIAVWTSPDLRGVYKLATGLPGGMLSRDSGGVSSGFYDPTNKQYWVFAHASKNNQATFIRRAVFNTFSNQLVEKDWNVTISGESLGLTKTTNLESPGFTVNKP